MSEPVSCDQRPITIEQKKTEQIVVHLHLFNIRFQLKTYRLDWREIGLCSDSANGDYIPDVRSGIVGDFEQHSIQVELLPMRNLCHLSIENVQFEMFKVTNLYMFRDIWQVGWN